MYTIGKNNIYGRTLKPVKIYRTCKTQSEERIQHCVECADAPLRILIRAPAFTHVVLLLYCTVYCIICTIVCLSHSIY